MTRAIAARPGVGTPNRRAASASEPARNRFGRATTRGANAPRPADAPRRGEDELRALAEAGAAELGDDAPAAEVVAWAARVFPGTLAVACSMADAVLPHIVASQVPGVDTLFLQTGLHFAETNGTRDGMWLPVGPATRPRRGEQVRTLTVRYRTVGDMSCTGAVESTAATNHEIAVEVAASVLTERGATRADDRLSETAMEDRKKEGYF